MIVFPSYDWYQASSSLHEETKIALNAPSLDGNSEAGDVDDDNPGR